ncbi:MAG: hypothetical protein QM704_23210 [Anaeromyxobacteraceae bacterium]
MRAVSVGLLVEEQRSEIAAAWKVAVDRELGGEPAIGFAVGPLLRELSLALRDDATPRPGGAPPGGGAARCAVLIRSGAEASRVVREFRLLHRAVWETLREAGSPVSASDRLAADGWLGDALAVAVERIERQQRRIELLERGPAFVPARPSPRPPPLPAARPAARPPPLPAYVPGLPSR